MDTGNGNRKLGNAKISNGQWATMSVVADDRCDNHGDAWGIHVGWGDGAVTWWKDNAIYYYHKGGESPSFPTSGTAHGYLMSNLFYQADLHIDQSR